MNQCVCVIDEVVVFPAGTRLIISALGTSGDFDVMYMDLYVEDLASVTFQLVYADGTEPSLVVEQLCL